MTSPPIDIFRRFTNGVYVIGVAQGDQRDAFTAAWLMQVSFAPLLVVLSINPGHASYPILRASGAFAVSILPADRSDLAGHYGTVSGRTANKLAGQQWRPSVRGCPILSAALASLECEVQAEHEAGDHVLIVARALAGSMHQLDGEPLGYRSTGNLDGSAALFPETF